MTARDERGSITPFVVIVSLAILMLAALVIDGGRQLNAKGRAIAYAQEAARAGAQAIDVTDPRLDLLPNLALAAASDYCEKAKSLDPQLTVCRAALKRVNDPAGDFTAVVVTTQIDLKAVLLGLIGRQTLQADGEALARPVSGISKPDSGKVPTVAPPSVAPPATSAPTATAPPVPEEVEVTPCTPKPTDDPDDDKDDKDKDDEDKDDDKPDEDEPPECKPAGDAP
ncbi:TadE/TadG family type IV pilus assembly protein [Aeromicrobium endophyticum]|uniref:TadE/TadG family type IV pilus assembly protein n=1 Tax=Aeromicrobium endophyticum TaxID=2292704 RepID=UPI0018F5426D|nr:Tad domain-containing protein [Aeromicrobium endophyticum]